MKVLLVSGVYPPAIGGPSLQTKKIAHYLIKHGIEAHVATYGNPGDGGILDGVPITFLDEKSHPGIHNRLLRNISNYRNLHQVIDQFQPDVIHMQTVTRNLAIMTGIVARLRQIPSLLKYSHDAVEKYKSDTAQVSKLHNATRQKRTLLSLHQKFSLFFVAFFQWLLLVIYDKVWTTTPIYKERLVHKFQIPEKKIVLIPNFIDLSAFEATVLGCQTFFHQERQTATRSKQTMRPINLLTVSRLVPDKGLDVTIEAISHLMDLPVRLQLVGNGAPDYESYLRELAERMCVVDRIEFMGSIPPERIEQAYKLADLFILASRNEAFGIVLLEAMATGLPIIATNVGGIPMVVEDQISADLIPAGDANRLAAAIRSLIGDPERRSAMSKAGIERAKKFGLQNGVNRLIEAYKDLSGSDIS